MEGAFTCLREAVTAGWIVGGRGPGSYDLWPNPLIQRFSSGQIRISGHTPDSPSILRSRQALPWTNSSRETQLWTDPLLDIGQTLSSLQTLFGTEPRLDGGMEVGHLSLNLKSDWQCFET